MMASNKWFGRFCLTAMLASCAAIAPARAEKVALTFDDLPVYGPRGSIEEARTRTDQLLAALHRNHIPAIGFVNEIQLTGDDHDQRVALLSRWLDAGMQLGNHSYSHLSLSKTPVDAYIADVARGEMVTSGLLARRGEEERWYRYPYLETGTTIDTRNRFEGWLEDHGYRVAPVTMENSDWAFADRYDAALASHDEERAQAIRAEYLAYSAAVIPWYREAARQLLGRRPAFVFLLHASRLNAASIDDLARILRRQDLHPVTLDEATKDPAYQIQDRYLGGQGVEWLTRWSLTLHKDLPWKSFPHVPPDIDDGSS
jgi:peptidoglycan-N-acetylglucosamine deacetylase